MAYDMKKQRITSTQAIFLLQIGKALLLQDKGFEAFIVEGEEGYLCSIKQNEENCQYCYAKDDFKVFLDNLMQKTGPQNFLVLDPGDFTLNVKKKYNSVATKSSNQKSR